MCWAQKPAVGGPFTVLAVSPRSGKGQFSARHYVKRAIDQICKRAVQVDGRKEVGDAVKAMLNQRIDLWLAQAQRPTGGNILGYQKSKDGLTPGLLQRAGLGPWELYTCLTSLREVEPTVGLILDDRGLDQDYGPKPTEAAGKEQVS